MPLLAFDEFRLHISSKISFLSILEAEKGGSCFLYFLFSLFSIPHLSYCEYTAMISVFDDRFIKATNVVQNRVTFRECKAWHNIGKESVRKHELSECGLKCCCCCLSK